MLLFNDLYVLIQAHRDRFFIRNGNSKVIKIKKEPN